MVTKEEIINAYNEVLKRPPENEKVIQEKLSVTNYQALKDLLYESREFKKNLSKKIILSYGLPKSASTYIYTITRKIIINSKQRLIDVPSWVHGNYPTKHLNFIYNCTDDVIKKITNWMPTNSVVVLKTHGSFKLKNTRNIFFSTISIRNPLDIYLSLIDHVNRFNEPAFKPYTKIIRFIPFMRIEIKKFESWLQNKNFLLFPYDSFIINEKKYFEYLVKNLQINVNLEEILIKNNKRHIHLFNKGIINRHKQDMSKILSFFIGIIFRKFISYYKKKLIT
jgi:hypothetical protein